MKCETTAAGASEPCATITDVPSRKPMRLPAGIDRIAADLRYLAMRSCVRVLAIVSNTVISWLAAVTL
jgi:hypothetical protein